MKANNAYYHIKCKYCLIDHLWLHGKLKAILGIHEIHHHCRRRRHRHHHHLDKSGIQTLPTAYATSSR